MTPWVTAHAENSAVAALELQFGHGGDAVGDPDIQRCVRDSKQESFNSATAVTPWVTRCARRSSSPGLCFNSATAVTPWVTVWVMSG